MTNIKQSTSASKRTKKSYKLKDDLAAVPPLFIYRNNSSTYLILFYNGNDSGKTYSSFSLPAPKLPSAPILPDRLSANEPSSLPDQQCVLLFFLAII